MRYFNVPMILQESTKSCWHASARMIWAFKYRQCIHPLSKLYRDNTGAAPKDFVRLAQKLGLNTIPEVNFSFTWAELAELLRRHGPLWAAGYWYGAPHIIVITGVDPDGTLYVNDPGFGRKQHHMQFFNQRLATDVKNPIMYLPDSRANRHGLGTFID